MNLSEFQTSEDVKRINYLQRVEKMANYDAHHSEGMVNLMSMGFQDFDLNLKMLRKHKSVDKAVDEIIRQMS